MRQYVVRSVTERFKKAFYTYSINDKKRRIYRCDSCQFMFLFPLLLDNASSRQMDSVDDAELYNSKLLKVLHKELIVKREIRFVRRILEKKHFSLLDIGCGTGWTSSIWKHAGAEVTGLEPSPRRAAIAEERHGLRIIRSYVEQLDTNAKYDVVVMRHVVEHIENPIAVLKSIRSHLTKDGLIVIVVPNINCIGRYIYGSRWTWVLPWHCNFFSPSSMRRLSERAGFDVLKLYQTPSPLWYPQSFLRLFPRTQNLSGKFYNSLNLFSFLPFALIVLLGYFMGISDNITVIMRMQEKNGTN